MVRGDGGRLYEDFREKQAVAVGWTQLAEQVKPGMSREALKDLYRKIDPSASDGAVTSGASQVWRFVNEVRDGDHVLTYSPANRTYLLGTVTGAAVHRPDWQDLGMSLARTVEWTSELPRDALSVTTKNTLGSTLTVFLLTQSAAAEMQALASGETVPDPSSETGQDADLIDPLADIESLAMERIKDSVSGLDWSDMQDLVAGILRAMGYKTQVTPAGPDRGKDIIASPDGFGFENPRIVVEVKHRSGAMGSQAIRSFLGGRHRDDRGLYVSTGGFSKDAFYEADRAQVPLTLWTLDNLVRALVEHYDQTDAETKRIIPLRRMYWPA
ncbi:restriction endonuclease [Luteimonas sp. MJ250]|uniref:restriction endonuclease n=1 Tax=Luteimonas sp. MJ250 TaxID=3129236 RepID=UPI0031BAFC81